MPRGADAGNIEVTVLDGRGEELAYGEIDENLSIRRKCWYLLWSERQSLDILTKIQTLIS